MCHNIKRLDIPPGLGGAFAVYCIKILIYIIPAGMLSLNLTQPRVMWEERVNEGLSQSGWPVSMSVGNCLNYVN